MSTNTIIILAGVGVVGLYLLSKKKSTAAAGTTAPNLPNFTNGGAQSSGTTTGALINALENSTGMDPNEIALLNQGANALGGAIGAPSVTNP